MKWFIAVFVLILLAGGGFVGYDRLIRIKGSPEKVAADYFAAWGSGDFARMEGLVSAPPPDFAQQHRAFSANLKVEGIALSPAPVAKDGEKAAHADFSATRKLPPGKWTVKTTLRMAVVERRWKVRWTPAVLLPGVPQPASVRLEEIDVSVPTTVARDGKKIEGTMADPYLASFAKEYGQEGKPGWVLKDGSKVLQAFGSSSNELKTTLDRRMQSSADAAVKSANRPAALVAVKPSTGEILAIADGLGSGGGLAFGGKYPPGSTFKVVTAAALLQAGMSPSSSVKCPQAVTAGTRTIPNHDNLDLGTTTLYKAFAQSCNTTFSLLAYQRLKEGDALRQMAMKFGFERAFAFKAQRGSFPTPASGDELVEDAIGQGKVEATPLNMAMVAAAVADGTWRSPRLLDAKLYEAQGEKIPEPQQLPGGIVQALRPMMRAVVTEGTAAGLGMPSGTYGKTGTAEYNAAGDSHAWFIGYRGDVAFVAFVPQGGSGGKVAAPLAARFLKGI